MRMRMRTKKMTWDLLGAALTLRTVPGNARATASFCPLWPITLEPNEYVAMDAQP